LANGTKGEISQPERSEWSGKSTLHSECKSQHGIQGTLQITS